MDARTFLDNFATIANAPGAVTRLRAMVRQLAVTGNLAESDSPAKPSERRDDGPFEVPAHWNWSSMEELHTKLGSGSTPRGGKNAYVASGVPFLRSQNVWNDGLRLSHVARIPEETHAQMAGSAVRPGDVLLNITGASIGRSCVVPDEFGGEANVSQHVAILRPVDPRRRRWVHLFLVSPAGFDAVMADQVGISREGLSMKRLRGFAVPIPPVAEQDRIVAKVDDLMGLCDELEARQEGRHRAITRFRSSAVHALSEAETPEDLRHACERAYANWPALTAGPEAAQAMRETVLDLAVQGRLVDQSQSDGDAAAEVRQARRAKASIPGLRKQLPIDQAFSIAPLPTGWTWATIDDLFLVTGGIQKSSKRRPAKHHFPYLRVANVQRGRLDLREIERFELVDGELERLRLEPGDLLVVEGNGSEAEIGRCARWDGEIEDCVHQNHLIRCRPMLPGVEHYLLLFLNSPAGMETMKRLAVTTSGLYNLSVAKIRAICVPLPPMAEQVRIRERVDSLLQELQALEASLEARDSVCEAFAKAAVASISARGRLHAEVPESSASCWQRCDR